MSGIEIYSEDGQVTLNSSDASLIPYSESYQISKDNGSVFFYEQEFNSYIDAQTTAFDTTGANKGYWLSLSSSFRDSMPSDVVYWFAVNAGGEVFLGDTINGYSGNKKNVNFGYRSGSGKIRPLARGNLSSLSGYLDVFDSSGQLIWSAASIAIAPRVLDVIYIPETYNVNMQNIVVDLSSYGVPVDKIYFANPGQGRVSLDEFFFDYTGLYLKRVGNLVYILPGQRVGNTYPKDQRKVGNVFGYGGIYIPIAYIQ